MGPERLDSGRGAGLSGDEPVPRRYGAFIAAAFMALITAALTVLFVRTLDGYYGYYYDNKFFNLLALDLWEDFRPVLYLGSHYHVPSSLYSYISYPFMVLFGPGDLAMEVPAAVFHVLTVLLCYRLGSFLGGRLVGVVFAALVAASPMHLVQVYTLPDLNFAVFLNVAAFYLFMTGFERAGPVRLAAGGLVYAIGCFQAIYSILLLPFFLFYSVLFLLRPALRPDGPSDTDIQGGRRTGRVLTAALAATPGLVYLALLFKESVLGGSWAALALLAMPPSAGAVYAVRRRGLRSAWSRWAFLLAFPAAALSALALFDLAVQLDYHRLDRSLGYYLDAALAGGYSGRPLTRFMGRELSIGGMPVRMSVLTSIFEFVGKDFARVSYINTTAVEHLYTFYFARVFTPLVRLFSVVGVAALCFRAASAALRRRSFPLRESYPLVWVAVVLIPFADLGPDYFNIRRIYILPLPYLAAAFGVAGVAGMIPASLSRAFPKRLPVVRRKALSAILATLLAAVIVHGQADFARRNIYEKYWADKAGRMYYKLFYGHFYGRTYKELGAFLLEDAPPREDGFFRAAAVYTIPEDSIIGRSLPLLNTLEWYTRNQVMTIYEFKKKSRAQYGTPELLRAYLEDLFIANPALDVVYFVDFRDDGQNFSYFSRVHPGIKPYAVVDDDGLPAFDAVLYRFDRSTWRSRLGVRPRSEQS